MHTIQKTQDNVFSKWVFKQVCDMEKNPISQVVRLQIGSAHSAHDAHGKCLHRIAVPEKFSPGKKRDI